ncbi:MAG: hypothetical protein QMD04_12710 [Anaerolineales bacterium]|nr:hypothetical protein [Anaerolineales bacterium]
MKKPIITIKLGIELIVMAATVIITQPMRANAKPAKGWINRLAMIIGIEKKKTERPSEIW